jgi:hypothetical protein
MESMVRHHWSSPDPLDGIVRAFPLYDLLWNVKVLLGTSHQVGFFRRATFDEAEYRKQSLPCWSLEWKRWCHQKHDGRAD